MLSELVEPRPTSSELEWVAGRPEHTLYLSVITLGELRTGGSALPPGKRRDLRTRWLEEDLARRFEGRVLSVDPPIALAWGDMLGEAELKGRPLSAIDTLIAAAARVHGCTVVTRNESGADTSVSFVTPSGRRLLARESIRRATRRRSPWSSFLR